MSITIKRNYFYENGIWVRNTYEGLLTKGVRVTSSPWGRGFTIGLSLALVILLPLFFAYTLIGGSIQERVRQGGDYRKASAMRDFSAMANPVNKDYFEVKENSL